MLKLNIIGRRKPGTTIAEHRNHIRAIHGEEVRRYIEVDPSNAPLRYVQNAVLDGRYRATSVANDALALNSDFVTQVWVKDFAALDRSRNTQFYNTRLRDDESAFVDQENVVFLPSAERILKAGKPDLQAKCKVFVLYQRAPSVAAEDFAKGWAHAVQEVNSAALRYVQNAVLKIPGRGPMLADAIDEFWTRDEAAAREILKDWCDFIDTNFVSAGLVTEGSVFALIATEDVVYDGEISEID